ncbi:MAG: hypothetical protein H0U74_07950 [Bradymonadaceae bacterium]|nr:hypothetical protein [Lujinxingiaceae bacterium]
MYVSKLKNIFFFSLIVVFLGSMACTDEFAGSKKQPANNATADTGFDINNGTPDVGTNNTNNSNNTNNNTNNGGCRPGIDENCDCRPGEVRLCSSHGDPLGMNGAHIRCKAGRQICVGSIWGACEGEVGPSEESCNGIDDNCDGVIDSGVRDHNGTCLLDEDYLAPSEDCGPSGEGTGFDDDGNGIIDDGCSCAVPPDSPTPELFRKGQACYSGPRHTLGVGTCKAGVRDCQANGVWGECVGEVVPAAEICGDGLDNNCNGIVDDGCPDCDGLEVEVCNGRDSTCDGVIDGGVVNACGGCGEISAVEICGDGLDNNCNGLVDEGCPCTGSSQRCYLGPPDKAGIGVCAWGIQHCLGEAWGPCTGSVQPTLEQCGADGRGNGLDNSCNGVVDDGCICTEGKTRPCGSNTGICRYGTQTCTGGDWSGCVGGSGPQLEVCDGQDNDCNGIVDNDLRNACGRCDDSCYTRNTDPATGGDTGEGAEPISGDDPENPTGRGGVTLSKRAFIPPYLWAANHQNHTVTKFNTDTEEEEGLYWVARNPSRTAVDLDGNMWVGGRDDGRLTKVLWDTSSCPGPNTSKNIAGVVARVNSEAAPLSDDCVVYSQVPNPSFPSIRGIAAAPDGKVWIGYTSSGIQSIDPHTFELGPLISNIGAPRFSPDANGVQRPMLDANGNPMLGNTGGVYGLVVDAKGNVYTSSFNRNTLARYSPVTGTWDALFTGFECGSYGIAVDSKDRIWTGGWPGCPGIGMFDPATMRFYNFTVPNTVTPLPGETSGVVMNPEPGLVCSNQSDPRGRFCVTGVAVEPATGDVWTSFYPIGYTGRLRLDENDYTQSQWTFIATSRNLTTNAYLPGVGPDLRGVGFDRNGYGWTLGLGSDRVWKIDPVTNSRAASMPLGKSIGIGSHYTYSDFTGSTVFSFTAPRGLWRYIYNSQIDNAQLDTIDLEGYSPIDTVIEVRVRALDKNGAPITPWRPAENNAVPQYFRYPNDAANYRIDLHAQGGPMVGPQFEVEVRLITNNPAVRPILHDMKLNWQRP